MSELDLRQLEAKLDTLILLQRAAMMGADRIHRFNVMDQDLAFYLPDATIDRIQARILSSNDFFESRLLNDVAKDIPADATIVDAGANIGNHTLFFAKLCQARRIIAFEPQAYIFEILIRNIDLNGLHNIVQPERKALGASTGRASLKAVKSNNRGGAQFSFEENGRYDVIALDSFGLQELDFLKVDVEGAQMELLSGARETLARCRPKIFIELREKQNEFADAAAMLEHLGFFYRQLDANNYLFQSR